MSSPGCVSSRTIRCRCLRASKSPGRGYGPMIDLDAMTALAVRLVEGSAAEIRPRFRRPIATERKADISPVTEADRAAEQAMRSILKAERPQDGIVGEEFGTA